MFKVRTVRCYTTKFFHGNDIVCLSRIEISKFNLFSHSKLFPRAFLCLPACSSVLPTVLVLSGFLSEPVMKPRVLGWVYCVITPSACVALNDAQDVYIHTSVHNCVRELHN